MTPADVAHAASTLGRFEVQGACPTCVTRIEGKTEFFQCARAIQRLGLWQPAAPDVGERLPSPGKLLAVLTGRQFDGASHDREPPARQRATLY